MAEKKHTTPKLMVFSWCQNDQHDKCATQYGNPKHPNIICTCNCSDHGTARSTVKQQLTDAEVKNLVKEINTSTMVHAAEQAAAVPWIGEDYDGKYAFKPSYDALTIEELEKRRRKPGNY